MSAINMPPQNEEQIPFLAEMAVRQAVDEAVAAGKSVLVTENHTIFEIFPDGTRRELKHLPVGMKVQPGSKRTLH